MYRINFGLTDGIELDEGWGLVPDPMGRCRAQHWWNSQRKPGDFFPSYDDDAFWPTKVPGAFNRVHPELTYYEGHVVYLVHFDARKPAEGERVFLHFQAVSDTCQVFLNGDFLGEHHTGYTPFTLDATLSIAERNRLLVLVDNKRGPDDVPTLMHDWFHDGGIHRPVKLYYRPADFVRDVAVTTRLEGDEVRVTVGVQAESARRDRVLEATVEITDPESDKVLLTTPLPCRAGSWTRRREMFPREAVRLWSPEDPFQYQVKVTLGDDVWTDEVGLREVRTEGRQILLNGEPILLRGIAAWMDDPVRGQFSLSPEMADKTVEILKDLNCNFARAGHRPNSQDFVRACNRAGILLWMEVPAYWHQNVHKPSPTRKALLSLAGTMRENRNAASVIIWSVGNECMGASRKDVAANNVAYFLEAVDYCREQDPSRLVTYTGGLEGYGTEEFEVICPPSMIEKLDVVSFNSYSGMTDGVDPEAPPEFPKQYEKVRIASTFGKPVILAEAGIDAVKGEGGFDFGEARQADYHRKMQELFAACTAQGTLQGLSLFVLNDFWTPIKLGRFQRGYNRKGLVTAQLEPKAAYRVVQEGYGRVAEGE